MDFFAAITSGYNAFSRAARLAAERLASIRPESLKAISQAELGLIRSTPLKELYAAYLEEIACQAEGRNVKDEWLSSNVVGLASAIVDGGGWDRLPVLADALQEAGCDNEELLSHLRIHRPHAHECDVVFLCAGVIPRPNEPQDIILNPQTQNFLRSIRE